jgi:hypothetical protein
VTRIDAAREAAGKTREQLAPYAASARDAAAHYTDEAWQRLAPHIESAVEQARVAAHAAQSAAAQTVDTRVAPHVAPLWDQARATVPPSVEEAVNKAAKRTRRAARQARATAVPAVTQAFDEAAQATSQAAQIARARGAAALPVLRGQVSLAEVEALAARHSRSRRSRWTRRVLVVGTLGAATAGGLLAWKWWQKQSNPDWLVEPPAATLPPRTAPVTSTTGPTGSASTASSASSASAPVSSGPKASAKPGPGPATAKPGPKAASVKAAGTAEQDGSMPLDPEVQAKEADDPKDV